MVYCDDFCCVASRCKVKCIVHCFRTQMETESSKESLISLISFSEKRRKEAFLKKLALRDLNLVGFFTVERFSYSGKKPLLNP